VVSQGSATLVSIQNADGSALPEADAKRIMAVLADDLK